MYTITVSEKGGQQSTFEFNKPEVTIGRMKGNDIVLPKGNVSKRHSRIFAQDSGFSIIDLESTNGTYVNGRKITGEQQITESDKIYIGDFILQVEPDPNLKAAGPPAPPPGNFANPSGMQPLAERSANPSGLQQPERNSSGVQPHQQPAGLPSHHASGLNPPPEKRRQVPSGNHGLGSSPNAGGPGSLGGNDLGLGRPKQDSQSLNFSDFDSPAEPAPSPFDGAAFNKSTPSPDMGSPRLQSDYAPPSREDPTVDRSADRYMPRPEYSQVSAILTTNELESEFDEEFHAAQHDVALVLFETVSPQDLPLQYPPTPEERERFHQAVQSAVATVSPRVDREELVNLMVSECVGLGAIDLYLDDPQVRDIYVNRFDQVLVRKNGKLYQAARSFSHPQFLSVAAYRLLGPREVEVLTDELRFNDGTKVHVVLPPLASDGPAVTVRKPPSEFPSIDDLVSDGVLSQGMAEFLVRATEAGRSILIAGPTSSGKTTLLSALTQQMAPGVRVVTVEDGAHLKLPENAVRLEPNASAGYDARYLLRAALAMHPQRIVLDECRGAEAYDWVTSAACGTEGSLLTLHGTSATDALGRLESLCLLGSSDVSPRGLREQIARAVNLVVVLNRVSDRGFRVQQITEVQGVDLDAFRLNDVFYYRVEGTDGAFHPTGYIPLFYEDLRHAGVDVDFGIFRE